MPSKSQKCQNAFFEHECPVHATDAVETVHLRPHRPHTCFMAGHNLVKVLEGVIKDGEPRSDLLGPWCVKGLLTMRHTHVIAKHHAVSASSQSLQSSVVGWSQGATCLATLQQANEWMHHSRRLE